MSIERIPCGGWEIDNTTIAFVQTGKKKVLGVIAGSQSDPSKLPLTGGTMLGPIELTQEPTEDMQVVNKGYVDEKALELNQNIQQTQNNIGTLQNTVNTVQTQVAGAIQKDGSSVTTASIPFAQGIDLQNKKVINMASPTQPTDGANKKYVDDTALGYLKTTGGSLTGALSMSNQNIINLADPNNPQDAVTKNYLENYINSRINEVLTAYRIRDLFGVQPRKEQTITLPDKRENVAIIYYSVDPEGNANISNSQAITVQAGQSVDTRNNFTVKFSDDMVTITFINNDETNSILGQYYGYNS